MENSTSISLTAEQQLDKIKKQRRQINKKYYEKKKQLLNSAKPIKHEPNNNTDDIQHSQLSIQSIDEHPRFIELSEQIKRLELRVNELRENNTLLQSHIADLQEHNESLKLQNTDFKQQLISHNKLEQRLSTLNTKLDAIYNDKIAFNELTTSNKILGCNDIIYRNFVNLYPQQFHQYIQTLKLSPQLPPEFNNYVQQLK